MAGTTPSGRYFRPGGSPKVSGRRCVGYPNPIARQVWLACEICLGIVYTEFGSAGEVGFDFELTVGARAGYPFKWEHSLTMLVRRDVTHVVV